MGLFMNRSFKCTEDHEKVLAVWARDVEAVCEGTSSPPKFMRQIRLISHPIVPLSHTPLEGLEVNIPLT